MDPELKREIIMENYLHPLNKEEVNDESYLKVNTNNESCIDNIDLYVLFDKDVIKDIKFNGEACAISTSATSIMIKELIGKNIEEAINMVQNFDNMVYEREYDSELLGEAIVYDDIHKQQNRRTCATLPWRGLLKALNKRKEELN